MKKIAGLLLVVLLAAGFFAYRYHLAAERLRSIASGGAYRAFGLKLTLSPPAGGVQGMLRLQPYLEIPEVRLDAAEWGGKIPLQLGKGRLKTGLWDSVGLRLVLDAGDAAGGEIEFQRLAFELGLPDQILSVSAKNLRFPGQTREAAEFLSFQEPWLQLRPGEGKIPAQLNLRFEGLTWEKRVPQSSTEKVQVGMTELGYGLTPAGADWKWRSHFRSQGVAIQGRELQGNVGLWKFHAEGVAARWDEGTFQRWKELWDALPGTPEGKMPALPSTFSLLRPRIDRLDFDWAGFDLKSGEAGGAKMEPSDFSVGYVGEEGGYGWKMAGRAKGLSAYGKQRRLELRGLAFDESLNYRGLTYEAWMNLAIQYYSEVYASRSGAANLNPDLARFYIPYIAHLPDTMRGELGLQSLAWTAPGYRSEHRDLKFQFGTEEKSVYYRLAGDFDAHADDGFPPDVKNGKIDFDFKFPLPYRELVAAARVGAETQPSAAALQGVVEREAGLDWKWRMDLGSEAFAIDLDLSAQTKIDQWLSTLALLGAFHRPLMPGDSPLSLDMAKLDFHLKVERLSKLQAFMDKMKSGASMALGLVGAYVVVDPKADALSLDLRMEKGEIWLNGKKNPSLETLLKKKAETGR